MQEAANVPLTERVALRPQKKDTFDLTSARWFIENVDGNSSLPAIVSPDSSPASPPPALEELDGHPSAPTEIVPPPPWSNTTQPSHTRTFYMRHVFGDDILAAVCRALTDGQGSPIAQLEHVESLRRDDW